MRYSVDATSDNANCAGHSVTVCASTLQANAVHMWHHYGDITLVEYAEGEKQIINDLGVAVTAIPGKKTPEEMIEAID